MEKLKKLLKEVKEGVSEKEWLAACIKKLLSLHARGGAYSYGEPGVYARGLGDDL
jgi:hypothetical protein